MLGDWAFSKFLIESAEEKDLRGRTNSPTHVRALQSTQNSMAANFTLTAVLPPLPTYTLHAAPPLLPFVSDKVLGLASVPLVYLALSIFWEAIDASGIWSRYQIHPTAEVLSRNRVDKWECIRGVVAYHVVSLAAAIALSWSDDGITWTGSQDYDVAVWATRLRLLQKHIPTVLGLIGLDSVGFAGESTSDIAGVLRGGVYPAIAKSASGGIVSEFSSWELSLASLLYWVVVPAFQFFLCFFIADTWFYWGHRTFHTNKYLYKNFHSIHHKLYVIYAFGAVYAHPVEGIAVDFIAFTLGIVLSGLSPRQAMFFNFVATWKAMSDHCGYVLPWDPFIYLTENTSQYHDNNFGIYFTFWDRLMGTSKSVVSLKPKDKVEGKVSENKEE
ncbi:hypothetical protein G7Y89_g4694 [Cudoniella acicularis]|uniref:Fatty acid hydroxylase domain-containing protein n=1 Tax=Cudoniella acicularis TaxID=354080 RepID=A0A8H4W4G2_9HELO|nr:hypothetical protein G7Y89_g4694 [Cudoniella acicularis]